MLTGLDPHPAPTPLNNSVSISGTRLPLYYITMLKFSKLTEYELLELQEDLKTIFMIKKNNYIHDLNDEEIEEIKFYKRLFKKISDELEDINV
jgi:hypothetical protein